MNNKTRCVLVFGGFIILSILGYFILPKEEIIIKDTNVEAEEEYIFVHIEGCVKEPGLIKVKYGTRVFELIEEAGGATEYADISRVNLASIVNDEQKVVIPAKVVNASDDESIESGGLVNINTASKEKLITLSGIGESTAEKIINYREENGYFNTIDDLMNVPGIGESKFSALKDDITV